MRLAKTLGLAAIAALATMAFIGVSSASAEFNTSLCKVLEGLVCPESQQWKEGETIHVTQVEPTRLLNSIATVLCLTVLGELEVEGSSLAEAPNRLEVRSANTPNTSQCGTNAAHTNCVVSITEEGVGHLLKVGEQVGTVIALGGKVHVHCVKVLGFITIECGYNAEGLEPVLGGEGLHVTWVKQKVQIEEGSGLCPETPTLDGLLAALEATPVHLAS